MTEPELTPEQLAAAFAEHDDAFLVEILGSAAAYFERQGIIVQVAAINEAVRRLNSGRLAGLQEAAAIAAGQPGKDGYRFGHDGEAWHEESAYGSGRGTAAAAIRARIAEKERTSPRKP